ncbi:hypothetical protein ACF1GX_29885 [Streptomyces albidoflavus]|uniref:hypothetical protein n=1 Tax=Streptomyces TaxID=1883 RepID=UPI001F29074E|nr:hypothetical protein [Streptomyces sp. NRRL F-6628]
MTTPPQIRHRRTATIGIIVAPTLLLAATACSSDQPDEKASPSATSSTSAPPSAPADPKAEAKEQAIATYQAYWSEMQTLYADPKGESNVEKYATSAALKNALSDADRTHEQGRIHIGSVKAENPTVTDSKLDGKIPHVILSSCLNISEWDVVDAKTKKPVSLPSERLTKYVIKSTVEKRAEGWRVISDEPQAKAC